MKSQHGPCVVTKAIPHGSASATIQDHHREHRAIGRGRHGADESEQDRQQRERVWRLHIAKPFAEAEDGQAEAGNARGPGDDAPVRGERTAG